VRIAQQSVSSALQAIASDDAAAALSLVQAAVNLLNLQGISDLPEAIYQRQVILEIINTALAIAPITNASYAGTTAVLLQNVTRTAQQINPSAQALASLALDTVASAPGAVATAPDTVQAILNSASNVSSATLGTLLVTPPLVRRVDVIDLPLFIPHSCLILRPRHSADCTRLIRPTPTPGGPNRVRKPPVGHGKGRQRTGGQAHRHGHACVVYNTTNPAPGCSV
jgi:hypothetical protein